MKSKFYEHGEHGPHGEYSPWKISGQNKKILNTLNDLIRINIDRITAYEKASHEETTPEPEIREVFYRLGTDSRAYVNILHAEVIRLGGAPVTNSTISGKIYMHWLDGKNSFEGAETPDRIANCMAAEAAIQKAYQQALDQALPADIYRLVEYQLWGIERALQTLTEKYDQQHRPTGS